MASNIGGTATLVGDPPNIIIASRAGLSFNDFLVHLAPIVVVLLVGVRRAVPVCCSATRSRYDPERVAEVMALRGARRDPRPRGCSSSGLVVLAAGARRRSCCTPCCTWSRRWSRWSAAGAARAVSRLDAEEVARGRRVADPGLLRRPVRHGRRAGQDRRHRPGRRRPPPRPPAAGCCSPRCVLLWGSAVLSAIVDNIPYVATMSPIVAELVHGQPAAAPATCSGGPWRSAPTSAATPPRSARRANVVVLGLAERAGTPISFWEFTKYGLVVAVVTVASVRAVPVAALLRLRLTGVGCLPRYAGELPLPMANSPWGAAVRSTYRRRILAVVATP